ncbi:MAG: alpha/beta hydrolase family protein [Polyangiales bacterium]
MAHAFIDRMFAKAMTPSRRLYADGFGEQKRLESLVAGVRDVHETPVQPIEIEWGAARSFGGTKIRRGTFTSPSAEVLPEEGQRAYLEEWTPHRDAPRCILLATTGEEGFMARRPLARWLARQGIGSVILENAYYGQRRPPRQVGAGVRTVADQFAMNLATVVELRSLLAHFAERELSVGATGFSQGGMMAAFGAALSAFPVSVSPRGAACSAEAVFTSAALSTTMRWDVLAAEAGSLDSARHYFAECLEPVRLDRLPAPVAPERAILVASRKDGFIPPDEALALHEVWKGSELRWLNAGHVTGLVLQHRAHRRAIVDSFGSQPFRHARVASHS